MTPIIDIVFLLIIFFLVIMKFIEAENFPVTVPDNCSFAQNGESKDSHITTVSVMKTDNGKIDFAVGSKKINSTNREVLVNEMVEFINVSLNELPVDRRIVTLRVDKDICFSEAQYALAAIESSSATDIQLAAIKDKHVDLQ